MLGTEVDVLAVGRCLDPVRFRQVDTEVRAKTLKLLDTIDPVLTVEVDNDKAGRATSRNTEIGFRELLRPFLQLLP